MLKEAVAAVIRANAMREEPKPANPSFSTSAKRNSGNVIKLKLSVRMIQINKGDTRLITGDYMECERREGGPELLFMR